MRPIGRYLSHRNPRIRPLITRIARDRRLLDGIRKHLPPPLDRHCIHAHFQGNHLSLVADSPAWGARLRFFMPQLLARATPRVPIERWRVRVLPPGMPSPEKPVGPRPLSPASVAALREAARSLSDPGLAEALERLAAVGGRSEERAR